MTSVANVQVIEFEEFNARLSSSFGRAFCTAESSLMVTLHVARRGLEAARPQIDRIVKVSWHSNISTPTSCAT